MNPAILLALASLSLAQPAPVSPAPSPQAATPAPGPYRVLKEFAIGGEGAWDCLTIDPDANRLYLPRSSHVMVLDSKTGEKLGDIPDTQGVHDAIAVRALGKGFTSNGKSNTCTVFDLKTFAVVKSIPTGTNPDVLIYEPTTKRVYVFNGKSKDATIINAEDLTVVGTIPVAGKPEFAAPDGAGKVFLNLEDTSELVRIDAKTMKVEARFPLSPAEEPTGLAIDPAHHLLFASCNNQMMAVVDGESGKVLATPAIGKRVDGAAFDPAGFAFASSGEGTLTVVATTGDKKFEPVQTLKTAPGARTITIDPKTRWIYLPTSEFEPAEGGAGKRPKSKPGTFKIIVVAPTAAPTAGPK